MRSILRGFESPYEVFKENKMNGRPILFNFEVGNAYNPYKKNNMNNRIDIISSWKNSIKYSLAKKKPNPDGTFTQSETQAHRRMKYIICNFFVSRAMPYHTEATFRNNCRADIYSPAWNLALEILGSEKYSNIKKKQKLYPCKILAIPANIPENKVIEMLEDLYMQQNPDCEYYNKLFNEKS